MAGPSMVLQAISNQSLHMFGNFKVGSNSNSGYQVVEVEEEVIIKD